MIAQNNMFFSLQDYMFTSNNIDKFNKHIISNYIGKPKASVKNIEYPKIKQNTIPIKKEELLIKKEELLIKKEELPIKKEELPIKKPTIITNIYKPKQTDSLFWCFYILKNGLFNYEMEIHNQYFVVEKSEKYKYIELLRQNKDLLKIHKIKPFTEIEDDLAHKKCISIKTFFALCIIENINVLLVCKRKVYELNCIDGTTNIVHKNTNENYIEFEATTEIIDNYRNTYCKMNNLDSTLKCIGSYKLDELIELCKKLNIDLENKTKKKLTKKEIYDILVIHY